MVMICSMSAYDPALRAQWQHSSEQSRLDQPYRKVGELTATIVKGLWTMA